jgi:ankyrin repeat protein
MDNHRQAHAQGYVECVQLLIEGGVDPELRDYSGRTAYDLAVNKKHWHIASLLKPDTVEVIHPLATSHLG